jgi:hypothetical protein
MLVKNIAIVGANKLGHQLAENSPKNAQASVSSDYSTNVNQGL